MQAHSAVDSSVSLRSDRREGPSWLIGSPVNLPDKVNRYIPYAPLALCTIRLHHKTRNGVASEIGNFAHLGNNTIHLHRKLRRRTLYIGSGHGKPADIYLPVRREKERERENRGGRLLPRSSFYSIAPQLATGSSAFVGVLPATSKVLCCAAYTWSDWIFRDRQTMTYIAFAKDSRQGNALLRIKIPAMWMMNNESEISPVVAPSPHTV